MRRVLALISLPLSAGTVSAQAVPAPQASESSLMAITHVTVIDVEHARRLPDRMVVVQGTRITVVTPSEDAARPPGAQLIDGTGKYLIPGLWDMHVHDDDLPHTRDIYFPLFVAHGVTGVRDMFSQCADPCPTPALFPDLNALRRAVTTGALVGPRVLISSPLLDGPHPTWPGAAAIKTPEDARAAADTAVRRGADFLKIYNDLPRAAFFAVAAESRRLGIPFAGHVPTSVTAREASDAGQRSLEHLTGVLTACVTPAACAALGRHLAARGTWETPTLVLLRAATRADPSVGPSEAPLADVWSKQRAAWLAADSQWRVLPARTRAKAAAWFRKAERVVRELHAAGVPLLAGTDLGNPWLYPGQSLHDELALLVAAGLTPAEALRTATLEPARYLRATDSLGTVAPGKVADLVLLDADPMLDIHNTGRIRAVVANGRLFMRADLDRLLAQAEHSAAEPLH